jgi:hypothetical protein
MFSRFDKLSDFLDYMKSLENRHRERNEAGFRGFTQGVLVDLNSFSITFGCIVDALTEAPPFGAGKLAFGLFVLVTSVSLNDRNTECRLAHISML